MRLLLLCTLMLIGALTATAQTHPETEDEVNANPTIAVPNNPRADTSGMANPPTTRPMPVPPPYSPNYRSTPDTTPAPSSSSTPQPGFPNARLTTVVSPTVNLLALFERAFTGKLRSCAIHATPRNRNGCEYEVIVNERNYPFHSPDICSSNESAGRVGCNYGNPRENSACILNQAMMIGYCRN